MRRPPSRPTVRTKSPRPTEAPSLNTSTAESQIAGCRLRRVLDSFPDAQVSSNALPNFEVEFSARGGSRDAFEFDLHAFPELLETEGADDQSMPICSPTRRASSVVKFVRGAMAPPRSFTFTA